jgi:AAA+ superfamily predicted ATPase
MTPNAFELDVELPNQAFDEETVTLLGFDARYRRVQKQLRLISDPDGVRKWAAEQYRGKTPPIVNLIGSQYPLFVLEGDVGTGKTAFARGAASRLCTDLKREGSFFALSTRVRGSGKVGEASTRLNEAFDHVTEQLGKHRLVVLLIDEADSLLTARSDEHNHLEDRVAVNTIIQKVDDLRRHGGRLVVFLATNRVETLDAAILRRIAIQETFERPNDTERLDLLQTDLSGLGLSATSLEAFAMQTGPRNGTPGYTFSDFRTRLLPRIVGNAFPDRAITEEDVRNAVEATRPSPTVS